MASMASPTTATATVNVNATTTNISMKSTRAGGLELENCKKCDDHFGSYEDEVDTDKSCYNAANGSASTIPLESSTARSTPPVTTSSEGGSGSEEAESSKGNAADGDDVAGENLVVPQGIKRKRDYNRRKSDDPMSLKSLKRLEEEEEEPLCQSEDEEVICFKKDAPRLVGLDSYGEDSFGEDEEYDDYPDFPHRTRGRGPLALPLPPLQHPPRNSKSYEAPEMFHFFWENHHENLLSSFESLLQKETFCDVTLVCEDPGGKPVQMKAHKIVLSACSDFFRQILLESPCKHALIVLSEYGAWEVQTLLDFMYRGEVEVGVERVRELLRCGESLKLCQNGNEGEFITTLPLPLEITSPHDTMCYLLSIPTIPFNSPFLIPPASTVENAREFNPFFFQQIRGLSECLGKGSPMSPLPFPFIPQALQHPPHLPPLNSAEELERQLQRRRTDGADGEGALNLCSGKAGEPDSDGAGGGSGRRSEIPRRKQARPRRRSGDFIAQDLSKLSPEDEEEFVPLNSQLPLGLPLHPHHSLAASFNKLLSHRLLEGGGGGGGGVGGDEVRVGVGVEDGRERKRLGSRRRSSRSSRSSRSISQIQLPINGEGNVSSRSGRDEPLPPHPLHGEDDQVLDYTMGRQSHNHNHSSPKGVGKRGGKGKHLTPNEALQQQHLAFLRNYNWALAHQQQQQQQQQGAGGPQQPRCGKVSKHVNYDLEDLQRSSSPQSQRCRSPKHPNRSSHPHPLQMMEQQLPHPPPPHHPHFIPSPFSGAFNSNGSSKMSSSPHEPLFEDSNPSNTPSPHVYSPTGGLMGAGNGLIGEGPPPGEVGGGGGGGLRLKKDRGGWHGHGAGVLPLGPPPIFGRHRAQHSAPRGGPPRAWSNADLTEALHNVWNKKMTTSQASRIFGIPYNSLLMYVRGKYGKSLKLDVLKQGLDQALENKNNRERERERVACGGGSPINSPTNANAAGAATTPTTPTSTPPTNHNNNRHDKRPGSGGGGSPSAVSALLNSLQQHNNNNTPNMLHKHQQLLGQPQPHHNHTPEHNNNHAGTKSSHKVGDLSQPHPHPHPGIDHGLPPGFNPFGLFGDFGGGNPFPFASALQHILPPPTLQAAMAAHGGGLGHFGGILGGPSPGGGVGGGGIKPEKLGLGDEEK